MLTAMYSQQFRPESASNIFPMNALGNRLTCSGEIAIVVDDTDPSACDVDGRQFSTSTGASIACVTASDGCYTVAAVVVDVHCIKRDLLLPALYIY